MAFVRIDLKFPCGYELKIITHGFFMTAHIDDELNICPLHGKNCTRTPYLGKKKK